MNIKKIKLKGWTLPIIALAGLIFALVSVFNHPILKVKEPIISPPKSHFENTVAGIGVIEPKSGLISIGVELLGIVREVFVKVGDIVKKGHVLFILDQRDVDSQITMLEKSLNTAKIQAEEAAVQFNIVSNLEDKGIIAKDDFNHRKYRKLFTLAKIEEINAQLDQAKTTKERLIIRAPIDGKILEVNVRSGEYANVGPLSSPLINMGDISTLHVRVEIDEENASRILPKSKTYGMKRGNTMTTYPLIFIRFEPYVRPKQNLALVGQRVDTRVLQVIYALPKEITSLFVGQQMDVFIEDKKTELP